MTNERREAADIVKTMVQAQFSRHTPSEEMIRKTIKALAPLYALDDLAVEQIFDEICEAMNVRMDIGIAIEAKEHRPWLANRAPAWNLWKAYDALLASEGRNHQVLGTLDLTLNRIIDHLGDPEDLTSWARRALVIGEVQSGKTSTYIGLIDKAIDVGYRVIVLLGGHTELLRRQTQERVDFGVIGRDKSRAKKSAAGNVIGVGKHTDTTFIDSLTTQISDFRKTSFEATNIVPGPDKVIVFVVKKNKTVLNHVERWFAEAPPATANLPMLLIDDESDYASVNTNDPEKDPTAINNAIRSILALFTRSSYVAFTATPFANIFIDDDDDDDLFPRDLIYFLDSPTSYSGCDRFFSDETDLDPIRSVEDAVDFFPLGHKKGLEVKGLPASLVDAIRCYLLTNAIRDLRGQDGTPTSMLVNVSRFVDVQQKVFDLVDSTVKRFRNAIEMHADEFGRGAPNLMLSELKETFEQEYSVCEFTWPEVLAELRRANHGVETLITNARAVKVDVMPLRHVSVGGDLLSRGLTLEGLSTSYFYRRTQAADTLMQMARWFGYRPGYEDLCRIWITGEMSGAYQHSLTTLSDLRLDLKEMQRQGLTPKDFGISVRLHPDALAITARNKMRAGAVQMGKAISLRGIVIESPRLSTDVNDLNGNLAKLHDLLATVTGSHGEAEQSGVSKFIWRSVDKHVVAGFLGGFKVQPHWSQRVFEGTSLAEFVGRAHAEDLQSWDVVVVGGSGDRSDDFELLELPKWRPPVRAFGGSKNEGWTVSGKRMRIVGPGDVGCTLSHETRQQAEAEFLEDAENAGKKSFPDRAYTRHLKRPVLLIFPIRPKQPEIGAPAPPDYLPLVAVAVAVPGDRRQLGDDTVKYVLNTPGQKLWEANFVEDLDDNEEDANVD